MPSALVFLAPFKDETIHLEDSGYIRVERQNMIAFLDVAQVGPDYLPAHAHADTLSLK